MQYAQGRPAGKPGGAALSRSDSDLSAARIAARNLEWAQEAASECDGAAGGSLRPARCVQQRKPPRQGACVGSGGKRQAETSWGRQQQRRGRGAVFTGPDRREKTAWPA